MLLPFPKQTLVPYAETLLIAAAGGVTFALIGVPAGLVSGSMLVDLVRGWMTDSRFSVLLRSVVTPPVATGLAPMRFVTRVTQRLRTMDKR